MAAPGRIRRVSIEPDTKDWTWVIDEPCLQCGFDPTDVDRADLPELIHENTRGWYAVLADADFAVRPAPHVWSRLEYACHVRDVHELFARRVRLMLDEDDPTFENWDQDVTAVEQEYSLQDPVEVGTDAGRAGRRGRGGLRSGRGTTSGGAPASAATARCSPCRRSASTTCTTSPITSGT